MPAVMEAIDKMTTAEKVEVMNYLWVAVASAGERFVPIWHIEGSKNALKPMPRRVSQYGALKDKISYMAPDFDEPLEDFAQEEDLAIITNDRLIPQYPVQTIW